MYILAHLHVHPAISSWSTSCPIFMYIPPYIHVHLPYLHEVHPALPSYTSCPIFFEYILLYLHIVHPPLPSCTSCLIFKYIPSYLDVHPALPPCTFFPIFKYILPYFHVHPTLSSCTSCKWVNKRQIEVCFSPDVILCCWLGSKYQLTN